MLLWETISNNVKIVKKNYKNKELNKLNKIVYNILKRMIIKL